MPFIRHTRDKRGYETTYVMHAYRPQPGPQRSRVLYFFRSPSHIKMGRRALDDEAREALEHTHPDVSFDWNVLGRESLAMRAESGRERERDRDRSHRQRRPAGGQQAQAPRPVPVVLEDHSTLGRVAGAEEAARLRLRYAELLQRVQRRARTPEERDRLIDRAHRLNPDDWTDEAAVRAALGTVEADWDAILEELPSRRRGRRGGRGRPEGTPPAGAGSPADASSSGIIEESGGSDDAAVQGGFSSGGHGGASPAPVDDPGGPGSDPVPSDG